jgi:colanic acid/amylovoran biosynthesis glycosyltransferase
MWREISHLRELGAKVIVYSTRPPGEQTYAKHDFVSQEVPETRYLWPRRLMPMVCDICRTFLLHPVRTWKTFWLLFQMPLDKGRGIKTALPCLLLALEMSAMLKRDRIDHIHVASAAKSALIALGVKELSRVPFSLVVNANVEWWGGAMREKFTSADFVVSIAGWLSKDIRKVVPELSEEQLVFASIGVDTQTWIANDRNWPSRNEPLRLVSVGRLHPSKGHDVLIRSVALMRDNGIDVRLRVLGEGPDRERLSQLIQELTLTSYVELLGSVSENVVKSELAQSHVFVLASHAEPLGVAYMEAMASGIATIGTNQGGVSEIISNNETGFLVPPKSPEAIASVVSSLASSPALAKKIGASGRKFIESAFDSRIGAKRLFDAIDRNLKKTQTVLTKRA